MSTCETVRRQPVLRHHQRNPREDLRPIWGSGCCERYHRSADGATKGFAFVEMSNTEEAEAAKAAMNGTELDGRTLNVDNARRAGAA